VAKSLDDARAELRARQGAGARYDSAGAPARELDWARRGTSYFARILNGLRDDEFDQPSLIPGLSRRYVITYIGYQARLFGEAIGWARSHPRDRLPFVIRLDDEEIRDHMSLPVRALRYLFEHSAIHLDVEWRDCRDADWNVCPSDHSGRIIELRKTPWLRAAAIWLHALDLNSDGRLKDVPAELLSRPSSERPERARRGLVGL
jgi:maleylpyruvate isomerase